MKVLLVDDSAMMRRIIRKVIEEYKPEHHVEVLEAGNGREALETFGSQKIDLVLLDWNMPELDGVGFVTAVRQQGNAVPIVMVSAVTDEDKIFEATRAGVTSYIEKPVRGNELWEKIKEYMQ